MDKLFLRHSLVVQGGGYAEHQIHTVAAEGSAAVPIDGTHFTVHLAPGAGSRITISMQRYANQPTLAFPWT